MKIFKISSIDEYMNAITEKNMEKLTAMVKDRATKNGYDIQAYHGTDRDFFSIFQTVYNKRGKAQTAHDVFNWFSSEPQAAKQYSYDKGNVIGVYLPSKKLWHTTMKDLREYFKFNANEDPSIFLKRLSENGFCGIKFTETQIDRAMMPSGFTGHNVYAISEPSAIKLSDSITYDDNGEIIPLEKRFDETNEDIRY